LFSKRAHEIAAAGIGDNWEAFKRTLAGLRRDGVCITKGEIDVGRVGIAAPIFGQEGAILGSLSFVLPVAQADETRIARLVPHIAPRFPNNATAFLRGSSCRFP